ncbi:MAG: dTDP-4-dehydrorhamnose 3,5-epimerase [Burkholderiaceae bacterium]
MDVITTKIPGVLLFKPEVFGDARGFFYESYNQRAFEAALNGVGGATLGESPATSSRSQLHFVQDNHSRSARNVLRGLHYQIRQPQGKLVRVIAGEVFDVAVDLRASSPMFGKWVGMILSDQNRLQAWIPPGFAHGFVVLSETAEFLYKTTDYWAPEHERCVAWDDSSIGIVWPMRDAPLLSTKDRAGVALADAETFA